MNEWAKQISILFAVRRKFCTDGEKDIDLVYLLTHLQHYNFKILKKIFFNTRIYAYEQISIFTYYVKIILLDIKNNVLYIALQNICIF